VNVRDIVEAWLKTNGYDGLYCDMECACKLDDLFSCDEVDPGQCHPGYLGSCPEDCGCKGFHICKEREGNGE